MAHMQRTVHAETMADLQYWLNKLGVLVGGQAPRGMSCTYIEPWTLAGTVMPGAAAHIAWHDAPANEVEAKARGAVTTGDDLTNAERWIAQRMPGNLIV